MSDPNPRFVAKPGVLASGCWAQVRIYIGQLAGPSFVPCQKTARPGFLTCWAHRAWERKARALRAWQQQQEEPQ